MERAAGTFHSELRLAGVDDANPCWRASYASTAASRCLPGVGSRLSCRKRGDPGEGPVFQVQAQSSQGQHGQIPLAHPALLPGTESYAGAALEGLDGRLEVQHEDRIIPSQRHRASSGASPGEPRTHPSSISPPMVWVANGMWRLTTTMPSSPAVATGRDVRKAVHGARSPRRCRRQAVQKQGAVHAWDRPGAGYTQRRYMNTESPPMPSRLTSNDP